ncbi:hypothetical protein LJC59_05925 [Desulfovibrio sp. OttesenSCG-928-A18]|nr:hypothetical protein [Desulfovibrio sp. OttesenSCG-928-A18]
MKNSPCPFFQYAPKSGARTVRRALARRGFSFFVLLLSALVFSFAPSGSVFAHGVYIFAWEEDGRICTDSYFNRNSKVRGGEVSMLDETGAPLMSGTTDASGRVCFTAPDKPGSLHFVLKAGQGHRGEFILPDYMPVPKGQLADKAELPAPASASLSPLSPEGAAVAGDPLPERGARAAPQRSNVAAPVDEELIRGIVREELRRELAPVLALAQRAQAMQQNREPGLRDIIGGLGWIAGLAGVGAYLAARRKKH